MLDGGLILNAFGSTYTIPWMYFVYVAGSLVGPWGVIKTFKRIKGAVTARREAKERQHLEFCRQQEERDQAQRVAAAELSLQEAVAAEKMQRDEERAREAEAKKVLSSYWLKVYQSLCKVDKRLRNGVLQELCANQIAATGDWDKHPLHPAGAALLLDTAGEAADTNVKGRLSRYVAAHIKQSAGVDDWCDEVLGKNKRPEPKW